MPMVKKTMNAEAGTPVSPAKAEKDKGGAIKLGAVVLLAALVLALAYYFFLRADAETFREAFASAGNVYIVMDVRNVSDFNVSDGILQCGVDFAGSPGMGGKNATIFSLTDEGGAEKGCIVADSVKYHPVSECLSWLNGGVALYVKGGPGSVAYTRNSIIVPIGANYTRGGCGIKISG